jgi:hypothetical protein
VSAPPDSWPLCRRGHEQSPENRRSDGGCLVCKRAAARALWASSDKPRKTAKAWKDANPDKVREHTRKSHARPGVADQRKKWAAANPDKVKATHRNFYARHLEEQRAKHRAILAKRRAIDPTSASRKTKAWTNANPEKARELWVSSDLTNPGI